ncbi:MAG: DUF5652 family protein [Bacteroidales bacterium]|nr:DUF5652 family protein [Bacteroidales bacterium]
MGNFLIENWFLLLIIGLWDLVWKLFAMYQAARAGHKAWYIVLFVLNTIGILPIIYLTKFAR